MKKVIFILLVFAIVGMYVGTAFAPLVTVIDKSKTSNSDTSTVDLSGKDTSKPVKLLR